MSNQPSFLESSSEHLRLLDDALASDGVVLRRRPFQAAWQFAQLFILKIRDGEESVPDLSSSDFVSERWFRFLYHEIESWYRQRYGSAFDAPTSRTVTGLVLIWDTPFALEVPISVTRPGIPGETIWLSFPNGVLDNEDPKDWLSSPPNFDTMTHKELAKVTAASRDIALGLRSVHVKLIGIPSSDPVVRRFLEGVRLHVELAAEHVLSGRQNETISRAYWEIQMACECSYKALLQQKTGDFIETHDLFLLHDAVTSYQPPLRRDLLKGLPRWKDMIERRYGQTSDTSITAFHRAYNTMLQVVGAVLNPIATLRLGNASFEIARAPWLGDREL